MEEPEWLSRKDEKADGNLEELSKGISKKKKSNKVSSHLESDLINSEDEFQDFLAKFFDQAEIFWFSMHCKN